jgi:hypothetical protein
MTDKFFSPIYCIFCCLCLFIINTGILVFTYVYYSLYHLYELFLTILIGIYYIAIVVINLGLFIWIVKRSFDIERLISLKSSADINEQTLEFSNETKLIFNHILLNIIFIVFSVLVNSYFDNAVVKFPLVIYICWTLGFTASLPINKNVHKKLESNQIKDYILLKSMINTFIFVLLYFFIRFTFYWESNFSFAKLNSPT